MNLKYLTTEILPKREQEIKEGKNLATAQPIYVVYDLIESGAFGHVEIGGVQNHKGKEYQEGYIDKAEDEIEFYVNKELLTEPEEITRFWTDRLVAIFLTSEAAHDYLKYQSHNLSSEAYVYVHYTGYANKQMNKLLNGK